MAKKGKRVCISLSGAVWAKFCPHDCSGKASNSMQTSHCTCLFSMPCVSVDSHFKEVPSCACYLQKAWEP